MEWDRFIAAQLHVPSGWFGRVVMGSLLDRINARINELTVSRLAVQATDHVLDIGFGGGYAVRRLAALAFDGKVCGVDVSETMVRRAERRLRRLIKQRRVELRLGDVSDLPHPDGSFDKVCTVNTLYFWPDPQRTLAEIRRVMKPGGRVIVSFCSREKFRRMRSFANRFSLYDANEVRLLLERAQFEDVQLEQHDAHAAFDSVLGIGRR
jgi:ubiquinone/menaquinone biosynthesis C-methylase UbiE